MRILAVLLLAASAASAQSPFTFKEAMVLMRDGTRLQTVILTPVDQKGPLPILLTRTPYGVPEKAPEKLPPSLEDFAHDGYIFVYQNLRGRFKSEGTFDLSMRVDLNDPKAHNETTDAYDTIDWLVKNVPNNNGRVGIYGVSYLGLTSAMTLLHPHPALKAVSEQASPADQWMNDDMHRYGALRLSYALEYSVMEQAEKEKNTHFDFDTFDTYEWYLKLGSEANVNARYLHGKVPFWNSVVEHPNYDEFWQREAFVDQLHNSPVPNLNVAGFWDQEDPWGPWDIFDHSAQSDPDRNNYMVAGPWFHGQWHHEKATGIGAVDFGGHDTAREFRHDIEAPFFRYFLHGEGQRFEWRAKIFEPGSNTWKTYGKWPPDSQPTRLYLTADSKLSFSQPKHDGTFREYVSDPANPVPYRPRPISPTYPGGDWVRWETGDQRFVDHRPDVLSYESEPLEHDLTIAGKVSANIVASTSGTDSDFIVKLIDVYPQDAVALPWNADFGPEPHQYGQTLNGYELPVAMEVRRGRFLSSFEHPSALKPNEPTLWQIPLRDRDYVFRKGHRIMLQIQSTWFPIIDRNPQQFVPSIYEAKDSDFVKATQRVYSGDSFILLPVLKQ